MENNTNKKEGRRNIKEDKPNGNKKKMMKGLVLILTVVLLALQVSAIDESLNEIPRLPYPVKVDTCVDLPQQCANCTYVNITSINYPVNNSLSQAKVAISQVQMTKNDVDYNFTFCANRVLGWYTVKWKADPNGVTTTGSYLYLVNRTGVNMDLSEALIYVIMLIAVFVIFLLCLLGAIYVPYKNETNERGMVIKITKAKYVKIGFIWISYVFFVWFLNTLIAVSDNLIGVTVFYGLASFLFEFMNRIAIVWSIFFFVLFIFEIIRDANFKKNIKSLTGALR